MTTGDKCSGAGRGAGGVQGGRHALSRLDEHGVADPGLALAGVDAPHATARAAGLPGVADRLGRLAVGAGVDPHSVKGPAVLGLLLLLEHAGSPERWRGGSLSPSHPYNVTRLGEIARSILSRFVSADDNDLASDKGGDRASGGRGDRLSAEGAPVPAIGAASEAAGDAVALTATEGSGVGAIHVPEPHISGSEAAGAVGRAGHSFSLLL